jgi:hypothetical protein
MVLCEEKGLLQPREPARPKEETRNPDPLEVVEVSQPLPRSSVAERAARKRPYPSMVGSGSGDPAPKCPRPIAQR